MSRRKFFEEFEVIDSKDSSWQERIKLEEYFLDEGTGKLYLIHVEKFENMRNPSENWKKIINEKEITIESLSKTAKSHFLNIKRKL